MAPVIPAHQKDDAFLADIRSTRNQPDGFRVWWLGQSGFLIQFRGKHLLFDPYLSDSLTTKYATTDKPHERMSERVVDPARLDFIDIVTSSHNHTDHLDAGTLRPLFAASPGTRFVFPEANRAFITERLGTLPEAVGLTDGQTADVGTFRFHGVPAAHNEVTRDDAGRPQFMGFVVEFGGYRVYHSGDTIWFDGLVEVLKPFAVDVAFLPINGNRPERRVAGNLSAEEAARLGREIGAGCVIPHHYHGFAFNTEDPELFRFYAEKYGTPYRILRGGERADF